MKNAPSAKKVIAQAQRVVDLFTGMLEVEPNTESVTTEIATLADLLRRFSRNTNMLKSLMREDEALRLKNEAVTAARKVLVAVVQDWADDGTRSTGQLLFVLKTLRIEV